MIHLLSKELDIVNDAVQKVKVWSVSCRNRATLRTEAHILTALKTLSQVWDPKHKRPNGMRMEALGRLSTPSPRPPRAI